MAGRVAPGRHVFFDAFVVRDDFKDLAQRQFLDLLQGHDNRHRAKVPERIELHIGMKHNNPLIRLVWVDFAGLALMNQSDQMN